MDLNETRIKNNIIQKICFITPEYPVNGDMTNTFIDALICEISRQGVECVVIAPFDVLRFLRKKGKKRARKWIKTVNNRTKIEIYSPPFLGATGHKGVADISQEIYVKVVLREFKKISKNHHFNAVYGHFWGAGGLAAQLIGEKYKIPSFVACGESSLQKLYGHEKKEKYIRCLNEITGIICVSTKNKNEILDTWGGDSENRKYLEKKMQVIPNGYFQDEFHVMDKIRIRKELQIDANAFVISFMGRFQEHKGICELNEALKTTKDVGAIFLGDGSIIPNCANIYYIGQVNHNEVAKYLNASDVFVLPTRAEGCSNAIVEAMACGLPVISSNLPFNYDILDKSNSILINPLNSIEIAKAINTLKDNIPYRMAMSASALKMASKLTIDVRAERILRFMNFMAKENKYEI